MRYLLLLLLAVAGAYGAGADVNIGLGSAGSSGGGGGGGSVTSVSVNGPAEMTASGNPVTSSGTVTLGWASASGNKVIASPGDGSSGAYAGRALVALDIPSLPASQITSGTFATGRIPSLPASQITSGQVAAAQGGSGLDGSAAANGTLLIGNGSGYTLTTITSGAGVKVANASGSITLSEISRQTFSNADLSLNTSTCGVIVAAQTGTLTASHTVTLPAANTVTAGTRVIVVDESRSVTGTNTIVIARTGADTIAGGTSYTMSRADQPIVLECDGSSKWNLASADSLPTFTSGWLKCNGTTTSWASITTSDVTGLGTMATQNATSVAITGGTIDGTTIGATTPSTGVFTTLTAQPSAGAVALTLTGNTQTTSQPVINATQTWNAGGVTFTGEKFNVTNTASAAGSLLFDYQIAGTSILNLSTTQLTLAGPSVTTSQPVLNVSQVANAAGTAFTVFLVNLTGSAASGSFLMDLQTAGSSECNVTRTGTMTLAGNLTMSSGTATVGGVSQANTNTATSGTITSVGKFVESTNPASSSTAVNAAVWGNIKSLAANAQNNTAAAPGGLIGVEGDATHAGTGTITAMSCFSANPSTTNSSGTVTACYGYYGQTGSKAAGTTITTNYGIYIDNQTIGSTNYALYTNTGLVVHGDTTDATTTSNGSVQLSGGLSVAKRICLDGGTGKTIRYTNTSADASVAVTLGSTGCTGTTAGAPQGWLRVDINGTDRFIPFW